MFRSLTLVLMTILGTLRAQAALVEKNIEYNLAGRAYEGFMVYDDATKLPAHGVMVAHDWLGLTDKTKETARRVAKLGYVAFAVDIYGKGIRPSTPEEAGKIAGGYKKDRTALRARMRQGLDTFKKQPQLDPKHVAVSGYCFGGTAALELARSGAEFQSLVSFHGGLDSPKPEDGKRIKPKVLILHGADDPMSSPEDIAAFQSEMRNAKVDWQMVSYGGAVHSFTDKTAGNDNKKGAAYNERADARSWDEFQRFLK